MKKVLLSVFVAAMVLALGSVAFADWMVQAPSNTLVYPYVNGSANNNFVTFLMISQQDTPEAGTAGTNPNVIVKFNPKCGRGQAASQTLTTKQSWVFTPESTYTEGWAEAFVREDLQGAVGQHYLSGVGIIYNYADGVTYTYAAAHFFGRATNNGNVCSLHDVNFDYNADADVADLCEAANPVAAVATDSDTMTLDGSGDPLLYNIVTGTATATSVADAAPEVVGLNSAYQDARDTLDNTWWGTNADYPLVVDLWRHSSYGSTMIVLLDPNGNHLSAGSCGAANCLAGARVNNRAQLDIYSRSETDAHLAVDWCTGTNANLPGIVTIGVGSTTTAFGTADAFIRNPGDGSFGTAAYGFGQAFNLRTWTHVRDFDADGMIDTAGAVAPTGCVAATCWGARDAVTQTGPSCADANNNLAFFHWACVVGPNTGTQNGTTGSPLLGVALTRISNSAATTTQAQLLKPKWAIY